MMRHVVLTFIVCAVATATDDFLAVGGDGIIKTKTQRMVEIREGPSNANPPAREDQVFLTYGPTVIHIFKTQNVGGPIRVTTVWVKQGTEWKAASLSRSDRCASVVMVER